jgi:hypothetical protein
VAHATVAEEDYFVRLFKTNHLGRDAASLTLEWLRRCSQSQIRDRGPLCEQNAKKIALK